MYQTVRASAVSIKPKKWDKVHNADKMEAFFVEAAMYDPDLIVTTEGVLEGYVIDDVLRHPELEERVFEIAEPMDGPYIRRFQALANKLKTCLVFGFAELDEAHIYNTAVFINDQGDILGKYHKTQFAEGTVASCRFNCVGHTLRAFDTPVGRVGIVICNDRWNPRITRTLVLDGAQLILIPSYGSKNRGQNETVLRRARENGVPIVNANVGMNLIVSKGEIVAYRWGNDAITTAEVDVPVAPSTEAARAYEAEYLALQGPEMERRYAETMKRIRGEDSLTELAQKGQLIAGTACR
jgi:predicted amidohydrolase